jgi:large subunit ribosomal protein L10
VAPAKVLKDFQKENEEISLEFKGGILEGKFIQPTEVAALAEVPGRQELYARLVGSLNAPVSGFVNVLAGNLRSLLYALKAIEETKN